jgi:apolipoprotein N-acyltransferase
VDRQGQKRRAGIRICHEVLYPEGTAQLVRDDAEMLAVISNDSLFGRSSETWQITAYSRILGITMRRSIARSANTGLTLFADPLGRVYGAIPWWGALAR